MTGPGGLPVRRSRLVDTGRLHGVVVEIDATADESALAVLQAPLHDPPPGHRVVFGYDLAAAGLGAWIGDRWVRLRVWPALVDGDGTVVDDHHDDPDADLLTVVFDPDRDATALADLARVGRLIIAGPDAGPVPLVVDVDRDWVTEVVAEVTAPT